MLYSLIPIKFLVNDDYYLAFLTFLGRIVVEWLKMASIGVIELCKTDIESINMANNMKRLNNFNKELDKCFEDYFDYNDNSTNLLPYYLEGDIIHYDIQYWSNKIEIDFINNDYTNINSHNVYKNIREIVNSSTCQKALNIIGYKHF